MSRGEKVTEVMMRAAVKKHNSFPTIPPDKVEYGTPEPNPGPVLHGGKYRGRPHRATIYYMEGDRMVILVEATSNKLLLPMITSGQKYPKEPQGLFAKPQGRKS